MRCQRCGKPVNPLRQLTDREFCSEYCRTRGPRASASGLRDLEYDEEWGDGQARPAQKSMAKSGASLGLVLVVVLGIMVTGRHWLGDGGGPGGPGVGVVLDPQAPVGAEPNRPALDGFMGWLQDRLPGEKPLRLRAEFKDGLGNWSAGTNWRLEGGLTRPGQLRLWKPTLTKRDYDVDFLGQIDQRAISWAFRAGSERDYYASKIVLHRPGEISGASIQRFVVQQAETVSKVELPLPVILQRNRPYHFTLAVQGNRFRTLIDGHVIDEWTDDRHQAGGVGFYSDAGEVAGLHWVSFRERRGILGRMLAAAFILPPGMEF
jgi:hypothetical protein